MGFVEVCVHDDASEDGSRSIVHDLVEESGGNSMRRVVLSFSRSCIGAGEARNRAVSVSGGEILVFLDADDIMLPGRISAQVAAVMEAPDNIIGCKFVREPKDATPRYTSWANGLTDDELLTHQFRELTLIQPTWCMSRSHFDAIGGYDSRLVDERGACRLKRYLSHPYTCGCCAVWPEQFKLMTLVRAQGIQCPKI